MEAYPHRAADNEDFNLLLYGPDNPSFPEGSTLTILSSSLPAFHNDDTWYLSLAPDGSTVWLIDCHNGVYFEPS